MTKTLADCENSLHNHPLPESYIACHAEAERRLREGWWNKKCPQCGLYGWEKA